MGNMFDFEPKTHASGFANDGYVHIAEGLTPDFYMALKRYVDELLGSKQMKDFAGGDKLQAVYEFLEPAHYDELREAVATICGVDAKSLVLAERHIKAYAADANPHPLAHKDRFGSEVSVGFSIDVPEGSTLVLYPEHDAVANPFNSTAELRSSFCTHTAPETGLKNARRVEIRDKPRDVMMFKGSATWHLRERAAGTTVLYLKLNTYNCDTLGEDKHNADTRQRTLDLLYSSDATLFASIPMIARKVDSVHRRYNRDWREILGVVIFGGPHVSINETEFGILQAMDGQRTVADIAKRIDQTGNGIGFGEIIRCLADRGFIDLLPHRVVRGEATRGPIDRGGAVGGTQPEAQVPMVNAAID